MQNRAAILGKERIDLSVDSPPDLAIEVDSTSTALMNDYESLAVPEVWIYRKEQLNIFRFDGQTYQPSETSLLFPNIPIKTLLPEYVERAWVKGSSVALREFETYLQQR